MAYEQPIAEIVSTENLIETYKDNYLPREVFTSQELGLIEKSQQILEDLWQKYESGESVQVPEMETAICRALNRYVNETYGSANLPDSRSVLGDGNLLPAGSDWITQDMFAFQMRRIDANLERLAAKNSTGTQKRVDEMDRTALARHRENITIGYNTRLDVYRSLLLKYNYISHATPEFVKILKTGVLATRSAQEEMTGRSAFNSSGTGNMAKPEHIELGQQSFGLGDIVFRYAGQYESVFHDPSRTRYSGVIILPIRDALKGDIYMHSGDGLILSGPEAQRIDLSGARFLMRAADYDLAHRPTRSIRESYNSAGRLEAIKAGTYTPQPRGQVEVPNILTKEDLEFLDARILRDENGKPVLVEDDYFTMRKHQRAGDIFDQSARTAMSEFDLTEEEREQISTCLFKPSLTFADSPTGAKVYVKQVLIPNNDPALSE